jgi:hypothetical protein
MRHRLTISLLLVVLSAYSQPKKVRSVKISDTIVYGTIDRTGDLYITTSSGQLHRYDPDGKLLNLYRHHEVPTLFDPRDGARLFAYFRALRQYRYLNPSFDVTASYVLDSALAIDPWFVCSSGDHNFWILDAADWSLKRIDPKKELILTEATFSVSANQRPDDFTFMREYQGFLFLLDRSQGIHIFNSMGKLLKTIPVKNLACFNFLGEELYYQENDTLKFFDLFSAETREMAVPSPSIFTLITDEKIYTIGAGHIDIFQWLPERR